jgi:hypothetical protein
VLPEGETSFQSLLQAELTSNAPVKLQEGNVDAQKIKVPHSK